MGLRNIFRIDDLQLQHRFAIINFLLFVVFVIYYDAIEMPNVIGYVTLAIACLYGLFHKMTGANFDDALTYMIASWVMGGMFAHNINFLTGSPAQEMYEIQSKRPIESYMESWVISVDGNQNIVLRVSDMPTDDGVHLRLQKGIFGVYFGCWNED